MPVFSHSSVVPRALGWGLLTALVIAGLLFPVFSLMTAHRNAADVQERVQHAADMLDQKLAHIDNALQRLSSWDGHCTAELFRERRREVTMNPGVIDFFFLDAHKRLQCADEQEPEGFIAHDIPRVNGLGYLPATSSLLTGLLVSHLYRRLPSGHYIIARMPGGWMERLAVTLNTQEAQNYFGVIDARSGEPLNLVNWHPKNGLAHIPLSQSINQSYTTTRGDQRVQVQALSSTPNLSLLHISPQRMWAPLSWKSWMSLGLLFVGCWMGVTGALLLMRRRELDPRRLLISAMREGEFFNVYQPIRDLSLDHKSYSRDSANT